MESRAKLLGHALHQMLIPLPLGLLATAVGFDLIGRLAEWPSLARAGFYMIAAGVASGVVAAIPGAIDWAAIPSGTRAKRIGAVHGLGNVLVVVLFAGSWLMRGDAPQTPGALALTLSFGAGGLALFTGWLGGELVDRLSVGVDDGAHLNSPNSLSGRPARENAARS